MRVLVAREKHGERIIVADTDEQLAAASLKLLLERWDEGWYGDPDEDWEYRLEPPYTPKQIVMLPPGSNARIQAEGDNDRWEGYARRRQQERQFYACVEEVAKRRDDPELLKERTKVFTGRLGRKDPSKPYTLDNAVSPMESFPSLWAALLFRKDAEYEWVELREVEDAATA